MKRAILIFLLALAACGYLCAPGWALITATNLTAGGSTTNAQSYTTASIAPAANTLILAFVNNIDGGTTAGTVTLAGNSLTWVEVNNSTFGAENRQTLFRAMGASPTSGAVTITISGTTDNRLATWTIDQLDGVDQSGTNGSGAIVQEANDGVFPATSFTVTLAAFSDAANATYGAWYQNDNSAMTQGSGFTKISDASINDPDFGLRGLMSEFRSDNDTTVDASMTNSAGMVGFGLEIKVAGGCNIAMNAASSAFLLNDGASHVRLNTAVGCPAGGAVQQLLTLMGVGS